MTERGIVVVPPFSIQGDMLQTLGPIAPESFRQYLLYWDKIDWPTNNVIEIGGETAETTFLVREGILQRTRINFGGFSGNLGIALLIAQEKALNVLNDAEPGAWSLAQASNILKLSNENSVETRTVEVELYAAVPIPPANVSLEDILDFKVRRRDELLAFRSAMDGLYETVISAADIPRAKIKAIDTIERSLLDLNRVYSETWVEKLLSSVKVELNFQNLASGAAVGAGAGVLFGFSPQVGAAVGSAAAALKLELTMSRKTDGIPDALKDFAYIHRIENELK